MGEALAIWALTQNGVRLGGQLIAALGHGSLYGSSKLPKAKVSGVNRFDSLKASLAENFTRYEAHIFIMATGIVVRVLKDLVRHKTGDPAVVVMDEKGRFAISLLSGHLGGANELAQRIAALTGAQAVITTATDVNQVPAIDILAKEYGLVIENPAAIKHVNMALVHTEPIDLYDPYGFLGNTLPGARRMASPLRGAGIAERFALHRVGVYIDDRVAALPPRVLVLRPLSLVAGVGCNRHTPMEEIRELLMETLEGHGLAQASLGGIASVDLKADEPGLNALGQDLGLPLTFYHRETLQQVDGIQNPSAMVHNHIGVPSVCEAAAILASKGGTLIVPKQKNPNVTVAIARRPFTSSASGRAARSTSP